MGALNKHFDPFGIRPGTNNNNEVLGVTEVRISGKIEISKQK